MRHINCLFPIAVIEPSRDNPATTNNDQANKPSRNLRVYGCAPRVIFLLTGGENHMNTKLKSLLQAMISRTTSALVAAFCAITVLSAPASAETLRVYVPSDPASIDPAYWGTSVDGYLMFNILPRLASPVPGDEWRLELDVAESVDLSDPTKIRFTLKKGLQWANGYGELSAEDVKYSYERHLDEAVGSYIAGEFDALDHVEITGTHSGIIHLKYAAVPMWQSTLGWYGGTIISKKEAMENDGTIPIQAKATMGAYTFDEFLPGERMVLKADPNWYGPKPYYDEVVLIPIADTNAAEVAFAAGELDFLTTTATSPEQLRMQHGDKAKVDVLSTVDPTWIGINAQNPNLADIRVRKAIQMAIDVDTILAASYEGMDVQPATGLAAPGMIGYRPSSDVKRDIDAARALIQEAGAEGMTIELSYANWGSRSTQGQIIQANLAEIGLNVDLNAMDEATFWDVSAIKTADRQMTLKGWFGNPEAMYTLQYFTEAEFGGWNWEGFDDPRYTDLMNAAWEEADDTKRGNMYIEMQDIMEDSGTFLFIVNAPGAIMYNNDIVPGMLPDGRPMFYAFKKK
jgi:peptide/nickel transport system substrate-binding protein